MKSIFSTKTILFFATIFFASFGSAQSYGVEWVRQMSGPHHHYYSDSQTDASGNFYHTGHFMATSDFDPGAGVYNLTSVGTNDVFVQKMDANGNFLWAKRVGGSSYDMGGTIAVDPSGNVYISGIFSGTADFDPGPATYDLSANGSYNMYLLKLDANGDFLWAKRYGNSMGSSNACFDLALDDAGNIYSAGLFAGTIDFDPGAGTSNMTSVGNEDAYLLKLDASGNFVWIKKFGGPQSDYFNSMQIGDSGNMYLCGSFQNTADFDPGAGTATMTAAGTYDAFILKLDASANYLWAKQQGGTNRTTADEIFVDASENLYVSYDFTGTADFDPGAAVYNLTFAGGNYDGAIAKLDQNGNLQWVKALAGPGDAIAVSFAVDGSGNIFTCGFFNGTNDFDPGPATLNLTTAAYMAGFLQKWDANGNFEWVRHFGSVNENQGRNVMLDAAGKLYMSGNFTGTVDLDPGTGNSILTSAGETDGIFMKLSCQTTATDVQTSCGPYTWINGVEYLTSNNTATYSVPGGAMGGCDSIVTLNLTIGDNVNPVPNTATLADITGDCSVNSLTAPTATDNCAGTVTATHNVSLPITAQGTTVVTWTYNDGNGNTSTQTQNVIVADNTAPVPDAASLTNITGQCSVTSLTAPTATDNCTGTITGTHNASLPIETQGTTVVTWTFNDGHGNTTTQTQNVIVDDVTAPVPNLANLPNISASCAVNVLTAPTATDNCAGNITAAHNATLPITAAGTTIVTWTYDDGQGNTVSQTQNVIISPINASASVSGITLTASPAGAGYQWVDCGTNTPVAGATTQSFTPLTNGSYAVAVTLNGCTETSSCVAVTTVGIETLNPENWKVYPNPAGEKLHIAISEAEAVVITDVSGKIIGTEQLLAGDNVIDVSAFAPGVYFIQSVAGESTVKFVKE